MSKRHLYILTTVLFLIGGLVTAYRLLVLDFPALPDQSSETWRVETRVQFTGQGRPVKVELMIPASFGRYSLLSQNFVAPRYGIVTSSPDVNRRATFTRNRADGREVLYFRTVVHRARARETAAADTEPTLQRSRYTGAEAQASQSLVNRFRLESADSRSFVALLLRQLRSPVPDRAAAALLGRNATSRRVMDTAVRVLGDANIPARAVHGLPLEPDRRNAQFSHWIEFWENGKWIPFDPETGAYRTPANQFPWWRGDAPFVSAAGVTGVETTVAIRRVYEFTLRTALEQGRSLNARLVEFSLFGLPLQTQEVYRILLVVPLGILFLVVLRNVIGIKTFGTFMPVLIALAFRETQLVSGVIMFTVVVAIGLLARFYLEQLRLLLVPRLACVVMVVIIIMTLISIVSYRLGFDRGVSVALFPIVILSMTIERMTVVWDERGAKEALQQGVGSLAVAIACYVVMNFAAVQHFLFVFPESLLIVLGCCLLLGRYTGYRLVELPRFRVLAGGK